MTLLLLLKPHTTRVVLTPNLAPDAVGRIGEPVYNAAWKVRA